MSDTRQDAEQLVTDLDLTSAAAIVMKRIGDPELEADRRGAVRALVHGARALSQSLDRFASCASSHASGVHCSPHMANEVAALNESLADWIYAVGQAARVEQKSVHTGHQRVNDTYQPLPSVARADSFPSLTPRLEAR